MTEALGFITGLLCVYLTLLENVWNFPIGLANNAFFLILFLHGRLFGDAGLQVLYIALGLEGWWRWLYGGKNRSPLQVAAASRKVVFGAAVFVLAATPFLMPLLKAFKDASPWLDAVTTALSLAAQFLLNRKLLENWHFWFLADALYVYLYVSRGLFLTAVLYAVFGGLCLAGLRTWRKRRLSSQVTEAVLV